MRRVVRLIQHFFQNPQTLQCLMGVGNQAISTGLVTRKIVLIHDHRVHPVARQPLGASTARRASAYHQHLARRRGHRR
jgi:hypothetical protein